MIISPVLTVIEIPVVDTPIIGFPVVGTPVYEKKKRNWSKNITPANDSSSICCSTGNAKG